MRETNSEGRSRDLCFAARLANDYAGMDWTLLITSFITSGDSSAAKDVSEEGLAIGSPAKDANCTGSFFFSISSKAFRRSLQRFASAKGGATIENKRAPTKTMAVLSNQLLFFISVQNLIKLKPPLI